MGDLYGGGPAGLTTTATAICPACGWTGPGRDAPLHDCKPQEEAET